MRGVDERSDAMFSYVDLEARVGEDHPLRTIRLVVNEALAGTFWRVLGVCPTGSTIDPAREASAAMLLQGFYSIRSERQMMERLEFDLLFRWFVGIGVDDAVWDHSTFSKNRDSLLEGDIAAGRETAGGGNLAAVSPSSRRSRFLENVSDPTPHRQRQSPEQAEQKIESTAPSTAAPSGSNRTLQKHRPQKLSGGIDGRPR